MHKALLTVALVVAVMAAVAVGNLECPENFDPVSEYCLHISTEYGDGTLIPPPTWQEARQKCQGLAPTGWTSDLVILNNEAKLSLLSKHIYDNYEAIRYHVWWVGARQIFGDSSLWQWLDGTNVDYYSNIWLPNQPPLVTTDNTTQLVPASSEHYRLYMTTKPHQAQGPSFVCEAVTV